MGKENVKLKYTEYFSKWRGIWCKPKQPFTDGQIIQMLKYKYKLR